MLEGIKMHTKRGSGKTLAYRGHLMHVAYKIQHYATSFHINYDISSHKDTN